MPTREQLLGASSERTSGEGQEKTPADLAFQPSVSTSDAAQAAFFELLGLYRSFTRENARALDDAITDAKNGNFEAGALILLSTLPPMKIAASLGPLLNIASRIGSSVVRMVESLATAVRGGIHRQVRQASVTLDRGLTEVIAVEENWVKNPMLNGYGLQAWDVHLVARTIEGNVVGFRSFHGHIPANPMGPNQPLRLGYPKEDFFLNDVKEAVMRQRLVDDLLNVR